MSFEGTGVFPGSVLSLPPKAEGVVTIKAVGKCSQAQGWDDEVPDEGQGYLGGSTSFPSRLLGCLRELKRRQKLWDDEMV